ncbi:LOW QUALITY PROTEIN: hypothetical protein HID58_094635 [Brassica napus]|uniref:F-box domain-containing protein n=2 Tax=Brassica napus TaxID=3708 RepID=A0ABQ7X8C2_BRANA|nr:LOW QUALITY PROTEIN: hypothetical protein HID58_094635 [Brassica napus]
MSAIESKAKSLVSTKADDPCCQRICDLPDDLLLQILLHVPTKNAMLEKLDFKDDQGSESFGWFIEKSLQLHKAPKLVSLVVELGPTSHADVDVGKWVDKAVKHEPTSFSKSLYTCDTVVSLTLSNQILVDVTFPATMLFLLNLSLLDVEYKDEDSLARPYQVPLFSSNWWLHDDSLTNFTVKVPSLKILTYKTRFHDEEEVKEEEEEEEYYIRSLVIDCPALTQLISDMSFFCHTSVACSNAIKFSRLIELYFTIEDPVDWLEPFICLLQNSPILKALTIFTIGCPPSSSSWNQPSTIPPCLSSQLETFK